MDAQSQEKKSDDNKDKIVLGKDTVYLAAIAVLIIVLVVSVLTAGFGIVKPNVPPVTQNNTVTGNTTQNTTTAPTPEEIYAKLPVVNINTGDLPMLGDAKAPLTVITFSDYQCPYCSKFFTGSETQIKEMMVKSGKVKMYFRDFPLEFHQNALPAATAARCAAEQGKFWEMHDLLFSKQSEWSGLSAAETSTKFLEYATALGMDPAKYKICLTTGKETVINVDYNAGQAYGVGGTPSSFIITPKAKTDLSKVLAVVQANPEYFGLAKTPNGDYLIMVVGALPYSVFNELFNAVSI